MKKFEKRKKKKIIKKKFSSSKSPSKFSSSKFSSSKSSPSKFSSSKSPQEKIDINDPQKDPFRMLQKFDIPYQFSSTIPTNGNAEIYIDDSRTDLRHLPFVTIDGITAKDFDDAIYVEKTKRGWTAWVSIADVDHYVKEGTPLDKEAYQRGNSTYFPNFVSPMLPNYLSQDLCSLNPHVPRLTMTAEMHYDSKGVLKKSFFYESVICSHSRLTYEDAQSIVEGKKVEKVSSDVKKSIENAKNLAEILLDKRIKNNSINLDLPETEIILDEKGEPINIIKVHRLFSHRMIEELMLAANQAVAHFFIRKKVNSIFRIHEKPDQEDLYQLNQFLKTLGLSLNLSSKYSKKKVKASSLISHSLQKMKNHPKRGIMHHLVLRALPQARYSAYNKGHFGLQFENYTHFTSPIRRYSDLIVHRLLKRTLKISKGGFSSAKELERRAVLLSQCEQRSVKAERQIANIKRARFMKKYIGEEFQGVIASVTKFGFFVTLNEYPVDGLVHINNLGGRWKFNPSQLFLKSIPSNYYIRQGDDVKVQVAVCNIEEGYVDFELLEHNQKKYHRREISLKKPKERRKTRKQFHRRGRKRK